jgi:large subunit ribosomal protein L30
VAKLRLKWIKSGIGYPRDQRRTMRALGFHRLGGEVVHEDTPVSRGMINKISHLIKIETVKDGTE